MHGESMLFQANPFESLEPISYELVTCDIQPKKHETTRFGSGLAHGMDCHAVWGSRAESFLQLSKKITHQMRMTQKISTWNTGNPIVVFKFVFCTP